ncbi:MAG: penicillin-binding protein 2 [Acinetobacter sp.]|nr:penicillin-binding protein 2 [Acinetobacter sp.]
MESNNTLNKIGATVKSWFKTERVGDDRYYVDKLRFRIIWFVMAGALVGVLAEGYSVQILDKYAAKLKVDDQIVRREVTKAQRGMLQDRNGVPLAISSPVMTVFIDPKYYFEQQKARNDARAKFAANEADRVARRDIKINLDLEPLARILKIDLSKLLQDMQTQHLKGSRYFVLKREVSPQDVDAIMAYDIAGVGREVDYKRYYPQAQANAQIVGMTNSSGEGIEGLEKQLNERLEGADGIAYVSKDKLGNPIRVESIEQEEKVGENISLSLDARLQYILYRELARAGTEHKAVYASGVAVDVKTGEILAMNTWPSYNPNDKKSRSNIANKRNRGAVDQFEPGSAMKPLTVAMGLSTGKYTPNSVINTAPGKLTLGTYTISDGRDFGALSLTNIIVKSSNVGVVKIALAEPLKTLPLFYRKLGFGEVTATGLTGETKGSLQRESNWTRSTVGTMAYGYGVNVTLLQMVQAYAILGNGGVKVPLSIYKVNQAPKGEQLIDPKVAEQVVLMMEKATQKGGTGERASVQGYRIAGKTGTARKVRDDGKGYYNDQHRAVFAGVAPVSNPRIAMVIVVDNPKGQYYGSVVAAPIFSKFMHESLRLLKVPSDKRIVSEDETSSAKKEPAKDKSKEKRD